MHPFCTVVWGLAFALFFLSAHPENLPKTPFRTPTVTFGLRQRSPTVQSSAFGLMFSCFETVMQHTEEQRNLNQKRPNQYVLLYLKLGRKKKKKN